MTCDLVIERGLNVITTGEEAAVRWLLDEELANELDRQSPPSFGPRRVGLNPGFIFDALLLTTTGIAWDVERIRVT